MKKQRAIKDSNGKYLDQALSVTDIRKHVDRKLRLARMLAESPALTIKQREKQESEASALLAVKVFIDYGTPDLA